MDDIRDQMDVANEISDAISRPVGMGEELDEDDLLTELEELEQEELDAKMLETPAPAVYTPNVPTHEPGNDLVTFLIDIPLIFTTLLLYRTQTTGGR